jgi:hypothetical protein
VNDELEICEIRMQRESYERAGAEAWTLGIPRSGNPFIHRIDSLSAPEEKEKFRRLTDYWFSGWDGAQAQRIGQRRRGHKAA